MPDTFQSRGGFWVLAQSVLMIACFGAGLMWSSSPVSFVFAVGAVVFLVAGALCGGLGALALGRNLTPFPHPSDSGRLVQTGIYALMRHPLYTAVSCGAVGWALLRASWPALLLALALMVFFDLKARREERLLRDRYPQYSLYAERVKRFIPWIY